MDDICRIADEEAADAVLIAGDVFDSYNPPAESEALFYRTMTRLADGGKRAVLVIAGNHDSPDRLIAADPYARSLGIITLGYPKDIPQLYDAGIDRTACVEAAPSFVRIRLPRHDDLLTVLALPYPSESRLRELLTADIGDEEQAMLDYNYRVRDFLEQGARRFTPGAANIVASHLYVDGGRECESERPIQVGGVYTVDPMSFPPESVYVGLGHLHRDQDLYGRQERCIRYAGSVLQYSFSEAGQRKSVTIVEFEDGKCSYRAVPLTAGRMLQQWTIDEGTDELERRLALCSPDAWISISLVLDDPLPSDYLINLRKAHPNILHCVPTFRLKDGNGDGLAVDIASLPLQEQFRRFVESKFHERPGDDVLRLFLEIAASGDTPDESAQ